MSQDTTRYVTEEEMDSTPTGLNMRLGTFVIPLADSDPTTETRDVADGSTRLWVDDGELKLSSFSLSSGAWTTFSAATEAASSTDDVASVAPIVLPPQAFILATGTPDIAVRGSGSSWLKFPGWAMDATADESVTAVTWIPAADQYTKITIYLAFSDANSGVAYMSVNGASVVADDQIDQAMEFVSYSNATSPSVVDQVVAVEYTGLAIGTTTGSLLRLNVYRNAIHSNDTYAADVWFLGAVIAAT